MCYIIFLVLLYLPQEAEVTFVLVVSFLFGRLLVCDGWGAVYVIDNFTDGVISMAAHYLDVVKDGTVILHALPDTVFKDFKRDAEVKAMLNE